MKNQLAKITTLSLIVSAFLCAVVISCEEFYETRLRIKNGNQGAPARSRGLGGGVDAEGRETGTPTNDGTPDESESNGSCGAVTYLGECRGTVAAWCEDGMIKSKQCGDDGCGYVDAETGYYCGGRGNAPGGGTSGDAGTGAPVEGCGNDFEQQQTKLTNDERAKVGGTALRCNSKLVEAARAHSQDMCDRDYFSHTAMSPAPHGASPFDRMTKFGVSNGQRGENIAAGQSTPAAVTTSWMNSSGHKMNILSKGYTEIGVGYVSCGSAQYNAYWTQNFAGH